MALNKVLKVNSDSELLSFIINSTPELSSEIDLPVQGESIAPIGKLIMSNERYKNAFINAVNVIGLTVIDRNYWENPWEGFINRGVLPMGQTVREMFVDLAKVYDYNEYADDPDHFLENEVPGILNYMHDLNYQKFYKTTTSDEQIAMAFNTQDGLMNLLDSIYSSLYRSYQYDNYIVNKYMLCRRIVDGTITSVEIPNYDNIDARARVEFIKAISNDLTFMNPNYNPAGVRIATSFSDQIMILNTKFEAALSTSVIATSFFRNEAEFKADLALIDGFNQFDTARLTELLGTAYEEFTEAELEALENVPAMIIDREFFQDYNYALDAAAEGGDGTRRTEFFNPETLRNNHWLHTWKVLSTSPFKQAVVFLAGVTPAVTEVTLSPAESSVSAGLTVQLKATVTTTGFANKSVVYSVDEAPGESETNKVTVNPITGLVTIPSDYTPTSVEDPNPIVIKATSVYDKTVSGTASISVL